MVTWSKAIWWEFEAGDVILIDVEKEIDKDQVVFRKDERFY